MTISCVVEGGTADSRGDESENGNGKGSRNCRRVFFRLRLARDDGLLLDVEESLRSLNPAPMILSVESWLVETWTVQLWTVET